MASSIWYDTPAALPILDRIASRLDAASPIVLPTNLRPADFGATDAYDAFVGFVPTGYLLGGEWDFAALELVVTEAGGTFTDLWGRAHRDNKPIPRNSGGLIAATNPRNHAALLAAVTPELP